MLREHENPPTYFCSQEGTIPGFLQKRSCVSDSEHKVARDSIYNCKQIRNQSKVQQYFAEIYFFKNLIQKYRNDVI